MASCFVPKLAIEGIQTVTPTTITDTRQTRQVLAGDVVGPGIFQRCLNIVHYYRKGKVDEEDSGWLVAGWIKETLGRALMEQPMICGRLRRVEGNDAGEMEVVSNDCGIRLIEASIQMNLSEFLDLKQREEAETQLVFWKDIDEHNPQFSPLFYVQVTNFQCGGYSVGISCSVLLADILLRTEFLKTWAKIHNDIVNNNNERKLPLFYLPGLKNTTGLAAPNIIISSSSSKNSGKTMIFKMNIAESSENNIIQGSSTDEWFRKVALDCVEEVEKNLGVGMMGSEFSLFVNESFEAIKVESCSSKSRQHNKSEDGVLMKPELRRRVHTNEFGHAKWDDLGANEVSFRQGDKPAHVSYWFTSTLGGFVIVIPSMEEEGACKMNIFVTIPN